jgi:hypothetical protein
MTDLRKMGGIAALYAGIAYIVGMVGFLAVVDVSSVVDPVEKVALIADNQAFLHTMHLLIYVIWAFFLVVLSLALYQRLSAGSPGMVQTATVFGLIWAGIIIAAGTIYNVGMETVVELYGEDPAQAATIWQAIESVYRGLGGSNEVIGGIWVLLLSWGALRAARLPRVLNYLGVVVGAAGVISIVPPLAELFIYVFALGQIPWFIWLGIAMLRDSTDAPA